MASSSSARSDARKLLILFGILVVSSVGFLGCVTTADQDHENSHFVVGTSSLVHPRDVDHDDQKIADAGAVRDVAHEVLYSDHPGGAVARMAGGFSQQSDVPARFYSDRFVDGSARPEYSHGVSFLSRSSSFPAVDPRYLPAGYSYARNSMRDEVIPAGRSYASQYFDPSSSSSAYDRYPAEERFQQPPEYYYSDRSSFLPEDRLSSAYQQYAADSSTVYIPNGRFDHSPYSDQSLSYSTPSTSPATAADATTPDTDPDQYSTPASTPAAPTSSAPEVACPHKKKKKHDHESHDHEDSPSGDDQSPSYTSPSPSSIYSPETSPDVVTAAPYSAPAPSDSSYSSPAYTNNGPPSPPAPNAPYNSGSGSSSSYTPASAGNDDSTSWRAARARLNSAYGSTSPSTPASTTSGSGGYSSPPSPIAPGPIDSSPSAPYGEEPPAAPAPAPDSTIYDYAPYAAPESAPAPAAASGGGGCSCDFWSTHISSWPSFFSLFSTVAEAFGTEAANVFGAITLFEGLMDTRVDGYSQLLRQGSAAILNSYTKPNFALTHVSVMEQFNSALTSRSTALVQAKKFENANTDYGSGQECEDD
ncbi:unnamed protein product [Sphagnum troendelagicum]|uniref:Uncharacterized protein n=1 Tax=Sphagnum troendelagicum TaxID=128251 RepID=A0ABP0U3Z4_9BRYO